MAPRNRQLSSTPLEILLFLNGWYYATYFLLEIFIFVYKGLLLPYPSANLALDLVMLFLYLGIEVTRIFFGSKGNLCQRKVPLAISLALTFPAAVMAAYYLLLQTYALRLEAILNAILLLFYAVELLLGILTLASFSSLKNAEWLHGDLSQLLECTVWTHTENQVGLYCVHLEEKRLHEPSISMASVFNLVPWTS